jgi:hypothetical protein
MRVSGERRPRATNPFSTRFVRPGALPFLFPAGVSAGALVQRLEHAGWWGQIVGPHGSGKSTLLETLLPELQAAGRTVHRFDLHRGGWRQTDAAWNERTQVVVDGYEQLGWLARHCLRWNCWRRNSGLLVTAHRRCGLPDLWAATTTVELAQNLVRSLLAARDRDTIHDQDVAQAFQACQGDLRETWFRLYDLCEERTGGN